MSEDGFLYLYALNLEEGGDCTLMKKFAVTTGIAEESSEEDSEGSSSYQSKSLLGSCRVGLMHTVFLGDASYADRVRNKDLSSEMTGESFLKAIFSWPNRS